MVPDSSLTLEIGDCGADNSSTYQSAQKEIVVRKSKYRKIDINELAHANQTM